MLPSAAELATLLTPRRGVAALALVLGAALVLGGIVRLTARERRRREDGGLAGSGGSTGPPPLSPESGPGGVVPILLLFLVVLAGAWLRVHDIDVKTLTHTEAMLPNLAWPPGSWPPARHSLYDAFWWHYHSELHPPAHYLLMWGWTSLFGTSLTSLRLPSALFGIGAILISYRIGARVHNRTVGLLAAAFVAFNGFHIFNSQYARVYMMGTFLGLLSTLALLRVARGGVRGRGWEVTYVLASWLAIYTQTFFWVLLATQMAWVVLQRSLPEGLVRRIIGMQALVVMVGAPAVAHQIYQGAPGDVPGPSLTFVVDYLLLGFAFQPDVLSIPPRGLPPLVYGSIAALAIALVGTGVAVWLRPPRRGRTGGPPERGDGAEPGGRPRPELGATALRVVAVGSALVTLGFVILALRRRATMAWSVGLPLLALALPPLAARLRSVVAGREFGRPWHSLVLGLSRPTSLIVLLALLPTTAFLTFSFHFSVLNPRAFEMFAAYLFILAAAGAWAVGRIRFLWIPLALALAAVHVASVAHWRGYPSESRDYRALAEQMNQRMEPGDLLFTVPEEHAITPLYYYLDGRDYRYVTRDYGEAVAEDAGARVWLVYFESYEWGPFVTTTDEMMTALDDFRMEEEVEARRARARLFLRNGS